VPQYRFKLAFPKSAEKEIYKLTKGNESLQKKLVKALDQLKLNPFSGEHVESSELEQRRVWVGTTHRLFYDIDGDKIVILHFKKKDKQTYK